MFAREASLAMLSSRSGRAGRRVGALSESALLDWIPSHFPSSSDTCSLPSSLSISCSDQEGWSIPLVRPSLAHRIQVYTPRVPLGELKT